MLWIGRKRHQQHPKNNIGAYKRSPFNQRIENWDKDKQSADDSTGTSKKNPLMMVKAIFFYSGRFTQGASYPHLTYLPA